MHCIRPFRRAAAKDAADRDDPAGEKAFGAAPQGRDECKIKNMLSAIHAQSETEGILNQTACKKVRGFCFGGRAVDWM